MAQIQDSRFKIQDSRFKIQACWNSFYAVDPKKAKLFIFIYLSILIDQQNLSFETD